MLGGQAVLIIAAMIAFPLLAPFTTYEQIADASLRHLVVQALQPSDRHGVRIEPTPALTQYIARRPGIAFAVSRPGLPPLAGSDRELAQLLDELGSHLPTIGGNLVLADRRPGDHFIFVTVDETPLGPIAIATRGNHFTAEDVQSFIDAFLPALLPAYGPLLVGGLVLLPILVRRMLKPLDDLAKEAQCISPTAIDHRLGADKLPGELRPVVDEINRALDRLAEGVQRQRLFTANAAHELRTPVAILQSRIDTLPHEAPSRTALARDARRLRLLVDQLLVVARLERKQGRPNGAIDIVPVVRGVVADCAPLALRAGLAVDFIALADHLLVVADQRAIENAVANLVDNAIRAEPVGGRVEVVVARSDQAQIEVRDHGTGVAMGDRDLVFQPFWRKDDRTPGTGLGLAAVDEIAKLHHGSVEIDDTPGGGAIFRLCLPLASQSQ